MADTERVVVTGIGLVTPLGHELDAVWNRLLARESAARAWEDLEQEGFRHTVACRVSDIPAAGRALAGGPDAGPQRGRDFARAAARAAVAHAGIELPPATGVLIGSTMGESAAFEAAAATGDGRSLCSETGAAFARAIADELGIGGPCLAYGTACAAGNYALGSAATKLRRRQLDVVLAGGVEPFSRIAMTGFSRSRAMSSSGTCRPFDARRDGMLLGEGAAVLVLERETDARARGARPLAVVGALGLSCDAHHPTAPLPDGSGASAAYRMALRGERLQPGDIDWICAHGTGTALSDAAESAAIRDVFGAEGPLVSGVKGALGHSLGAATAIEAALCVMAIARGVVPPTLGLNEPEFPLRFVREPTPCAPRWVANAGFAFGGLNSVLLLGAV